MKAPSSAMLAVLAAILVPSMAGWRDAGAQAYPTRPVSIVVPFPPGGNIDGFTRIVAEKLGPRIGQTVLVENRPGASGATGTVHVARAASDGHTLLIASQTAFAALPNLRPNVGYDPFKSFTPVSLLVYNPPIWLIGRASMPINNLKELVAYAKANPGKLNFSSDGVGTNTHVALEHLKKAAGIDVAHIPYPGSAAQTTALLGGQIDFSYQLMPAPLPHIRSGKLKGIASTAPVRLDPDKNLMTVAEQGYPGFDIRVWYGLVATGGTPAPVADRLSRELAVVLNDADLIERLKPFGHERVGSTPGELAKIIKEEYAVWKKLVDELNLKMAE